MMAAGAVLLVIVAIIIGVLRYDAKYAENSVLSTYSPNGEYFLDISQIGKPEADSGGVNCRFQLIRGPRDVNTYDTQVFHGGNAVSAENFEVKWGRNGAVITVTGDSQDEITYRVNYDGTTTSTP